MHEHPPTSSGCSHDLKYCSQCDEVYCEKCKKEWGKERMVTINNDKSQVPSAPYMPPYYFGQPKPNPSDQPYIVTCKHTN